MFSYMGERILAAVIIVRVLRWVVIDPGDPKYDHLHAYPRETDGVSLTQAEEEAKWLWRQRPDQRKLAANSRGKKRIPLHLQ